MLEIRKMRKKEFIIYTIVNIINSIDMQVLSKISFTCFIINGVTAIIRCIIRKK